MNKKLNRKKIADGIYFSTYNDTRFQKNRIEIRFIDTLDSESASLNAIVPAIISRSNNQYKTMKELNLKLSELYSAEICDYVSKIGDVSEFGLYSYSLSSKFAYDGENVLEEIAVILRDCLFDPYLENGVFPESVVELQKQNLIDANNNEINNKAKYASRKAHAKAYENEPASVRINGENSEIEKITAESAYKQYLKIIETKHVEIMCIGSEDFSLVEKIFTEAFAKINRHPEQEPKSMWSVIKNDVSEISEQMNIEQSKLILVFKTNYNEWINSSLMSFMFGGDVSSKLFTIVREKLSLCYYCSSSYSRYKNSMSVTCGVDTKNIEKAKEAILEQLEEIKKGNFTDEDMTKAKLAIATPLTAVKDFMDSITSWYFACIDNKELIEPADRIKMYNDVTREKIIEAANAVKLDTVFVLCPKEENI